MSSKVLVVFGILLFAAQAVKGRTTTDIPYLGGGRRLLNGDDAGKGEFPHQVSLSKIDASGRNSGHLCGGSIINSLWILTAAHCVLDVPPNRLIVKAGITSLERHESSEQSVPVASIFKHRFFKGTKSEASSHDIALLKLRTPLKLNKLVGKISLPKIGTKPTGYGTVSGWGSVRRDFELRSRILQKADLSIIDYATCRSLMGNLIDPTHICAGGATDRAATCNADSGGPLIQEKASGVVELIGVLSWGSGNICDVEDYPAAFVDVAQFVDWIQATMKKH